jgi:hypothetical protein
MVTAVVKQSILPPDVIAENSVLHRNKLYPREVAVCKCNGYGPINEKCIYSLPFRHFRPLFLVPLPPLAFIFPMR